MRDASALIENELLMDPLRQRLVVCLSLITPITTIGKRYIDKVEGDH